MNNCWICGKPATKSFGVYNVLETAKVKEKYDLAAFEVKNFTEPSQGQRAYCDNCFAKALSEKQELVTRYRVLGAHIMCERAIRILEKGKVNVYEYKTAIEKVTDYVIQESDKFDSADEVAAAMVLIHKGYSIKMQFSVGRYRVDIALPNDKLLIELDGPTHEKRKKQDQERDAKIISTLPQGWRIVRIPTNLFEQNPSKLIQAVNAVLKERHKNEVRYAR